MTRIRQMIWNTRGTWQEVPLNEQASCLRGASPAREPGRQVDVLGRMPEDARQADDGHEPQEPDEEPDEDEEFYSDNPSTVNGGTQRRVLRRPAEDLDPETETIDGAPVVRGNVGEVEDTRDYVPPNLRDEDDDPRVEGGTSSAERGKREREYNSISSSISRGESDMKPFSAKEARTAGRDRQHRQPATYPDRRPATADYHNCDGRVLFR